MTSVTLSPARLCVLQLGGALGEGLGVDEVSGHGRFVLSAKPCTAGTSAVESGVPLSAQLTAIPRGEHMNGHSLVLVVFLAVSLIAVGFSVWRGVVNR
jgi:hypothetical protein